MKTRFKNYFAVFFAIAIFCMTLTGCGNGTPASSESTAASSSSGTGSTAASSSSGTENKPVDYSNDIINYGLSTAWDSLNPYGSASGVIQTTLVMDKLYDKLVYVGENAGAFSPRAAKSWEISEDSKTITFHLDPNAKWHDGVPVTSADWLFSLRLVTDPNYSFKFRSNFSIYEGTDKSGVELSENSVGAEAPDKNTLVLHLKKSTNLDVYLAQYMYNCIVLPEHLLGSIKPAEVAASDFWSKPVGSGPCTFVSEVPGNTLELASFSDYQLGAPKFGKLVFKVVAAANVVSATMSGDIDYAYPHLTIDDAAYAQQQSGLVVAKSSFPTRLSFMLVNNKKITDKLVREAMNYAIDKELIVNQLISGQGKVAESYVLPSSDYLDKNITFKRDVEKAKALLAQAGWDSSKTLKIAVPSDVRAKIAAILKQNFNEVGINLEIVTVDTATMFSGLMDGTYDLSIMFMPGSNNPLYLWWYTDYRMANYSSITDQRYAELQDQIKGVSDVQKVKELVNQLQTLMEDEMPNINLFHQYNFALTSTRLTGITPFDTPQYNDAVWNWKVK